MKNNTFAKCEKQLYKYDCWAKSLQNILNILFEKNTLEYGEILKQLKTTRFWWTFPKYIKAFVDNYQISYHNNMNDIKVSSVNIFLIDWNKFYKDNIDYGHYFISKKIDFNLHKVFDVWDKKIHIIEEKELINLTKNVLVWKTRFSDICFSFNFL